MSYNWSTSSRSMNILANLRNRMIFLLRDKRFWSFDLPRYLKIELYSLDEFAHQLCKLNVLKGKEWYQFISNLRIRTTHPPCDLTLWSLINIARIRVRRSRCNATGQSQQLNKLLVCPNPSQTPRWMALPMWLLDWFSRPDWYLLLWMLLSLLISWSA